MGAIKYMSEWELWWTKCHDNDDNAYGFYRLVWK